MKKTLRFSILSLLLMLCGTAMATDITFTAGTEVGTQTNAGDGADQMSKDGITISVTKGALAAAQYRFAKGETMTITSTVGNITKVEFTCTASGEEKYGPGNFTDVSSGTYSFEGNVGTWTGDAPEFSMIASKNQVRATTIVVTVNGSAPVQTKANKPVITPNGGTFEESIDVTITADQGATIRYSLDDSETWQDYTGAFTLTETTTVIAYAIDESKDVKNSDEVQATFTKVEPQQVVVGTCQDVINGQDGTIFRVKGKCTNILNTTYGNWDLEDETGTIRIYGTLDAEGKTKNFLSLGIEVGDIVTVQGPRKDFNGTIELVDVTVISIEKGSAPEPEIEKISVAKALEIIAGLADGAKTAEQYDVEGYVVTTPDFQRKADDTLYGNVNFDMADQADGTDVLTVFRAKNIDNASFTEETINSPVKGDKVVVRGLLQKYVKDGVTTPELSSCYLISVDGTTNAISQLKASSEDGAAYNLQGQRVVAPTKGLYIINGKKVMK